MAERALPKAGERQAAVMDVKIDSSQFTAFEVLLTNISDNLYNIAGFMGAQVSALKQTEQALKDMRSQQEGQGIEAAREAKERKATVNPIEKTMSLFEKLFAVILPYVLGFLLGLSKKWGLLIAAIFIFRNQILTLVKLIASAIPALTRGFAYFAGMLFKAASTIGKGFKDFFTAIPKAAKALSAGAVNAFNKALSFVTRFGAAIAESATKLRSNFPKVFEKFAKITETTVKNIFASISKGLEAAKTFFTSLGPRIAKAATNTYRAIIVIFADTINKVTQFFTKIRTFFSGSGKLVETIVTKTSTLFYKFYSAMLKVGEVFKRVRDSLSPLTKFLGSAIDDVVKVASSVGNFFKGSFVKAMNFVINSFKAVPQFLKNLGMFGNEASKAGGFVSKITQSFAKGTEFFSKIGGFVAKMGGLARTLGPIGAIVSAAMALFKGVKQMFAGFNEEGVFGAIKGFTSGFISAFIGWIGDFGSWLVGKLLSLLGFEELGERIAALDFTEMLNQAISNLFDGVKNAFMGMFDKLSGGFSKIFSGEDIIGGIIDVFSALPMMLIDLITAPFNALGDAIREVFDFDIGTIAKKIIIAMFPPDTLLGKAIRGALGDLEAEVAESDKAMEQQKRDRAAARNEPVVEPVRESRGGGGGGFRGGSGGNPTGARTVDSQGRPLIDSEGRRTELGLQQRVTTSAQDNAMYNDPVERKRMEKEWAEYQAGQRKEEDLTNLDDYNRYLERTTGQKLSEQELLRIGTPDDPNHPDFGKPSKLSGVPTGVPGPALIADSQAVQGAGRGGSQTNVVAPTTNAPSSVVNSQANYATTLSAVPTFGIQSSGGQPALAF